MQRFRKVKMKYLLLVVSLVASLTYGTTKVKLIRGYPETIETKINTFIQNKLNVKIKFTSVARNFNLVEHYALVSYEEFETRKS